MNTRQDRAHRLARIGPTLLAALLAACSGSVLAAAADETADPAAATRIEADVRFLANDLLEGRETGTRGHELAALYVANRMRALGLQPAGDAGSFYQQVRLLSGVRDASGARFSVRRGASTREFRFREEFLSGISFSAGSAEITAPMVFVGHGVRAAELGYDDLAGVDVRGKIAVLFGNSPVRFPSDQRALHADSVEKYTELERLGAVGVIAIHDPETARNYPWELATASWDKPLMKGVDRTGQPIDDYPGLRVRVSCSLAAAAALFEGSGHDFREVVAGIEKGSSKSFALAGTATLATRATLKPVSSPNVVARLPGADPKLANEHVLFTAHLDHLGIGLPKDGDAIYNGALDNALGVSILLEAARSLAGGGTPPARSMLFIATTAEEQGLLGAQYFARHPTVPADSLVAAVNMDMPMAFGDLGDVVPIGNEHSSLQAVVERVVAEAGLRISPDPDPGEVVFIRSDQYAFVRVGVPAINLDAGYRPRDGSDGKARQQEFLDKRYHLPGDDLTVALNWSYAALLARINARIGLAIASDPLRPSWNKGDYFGERFARPR